MPGSKYVYSDAQVTRVLNIFGALLLNISESSTPCEIALYLP